MKSISFVPGAVRPALIALLAGVFVAACGTTEDPDPRTAEDRLGLPAWYVDRETPDEPMVIYGFGASQAEPDYPDQMRRQARANAAAEVAEQLTQTVQALNSEYFDRQDLGTDNEQDARTRQQLQQTVEQWVDQTLVGMSYERTDVTEDGRWVVMARYDLEQDFSAYFDAIGADEDGLRSDLRGAAQEHLERLRERTGN